jgi:2-polyprenyl-3-methyl-5-hydroxy-6-metoxy-1,4-benzoquinol methylase
MQNNWEEGDYSLNKIESWFSNFGVTDTSYLRSHFARFSRTFDFCSVTLPKQATILDVGCHWLHQSFFFASRGHHVVGADAPNTLRLDSVRRVAAQLKVDLVSYTRLDLGQGLADLPSDSFDQVIFSEIIEHLAFNPLVLWKQIYRIMKPGARLLITTPNSMYYRRIISRLKSLVQSSEYGIGVDDIFSAGTYGHHWKEFSVPELTRYFGLVSTDFHIETCSIETFGNSLREERINARVEMDKSSDITEYFNLEGVISRLEASCSHPYGSQILMSLKLEEKRAGIVLSPPWFVE